MDAASAGSGSRGTASCLSSTATTHGTHPVERLLCLADRRLGASTHPAAQCVRRSALHSKTRAGHATRRLAAAAEAASGLGGVDGASLLYLNPHPTPLVIRANASAAKLAMQWRRKAAVDDLVRQQDVMSTACATSAFDPAFSRTRLDRSAICAALDETGDLLESLKSLRYDGCHADTASELAGATAAASRRRQPGSPSGGAGCGDSGPPLPHRATARQRLRRKMEAVRGDTRSFSRGIAAARQRRAEKHAVNFVEENAAQAYCSTAQQGAASQSRRQTHRQRSEAALERRAARDCVWYNLEADLAQAAVRQEEAAQLEKRQRGLLGCAVFALSACTWGAHCREAWLARCLEERRHGAAVVLQTRLYPMFKRYRQGVAFLDGARETKRRMSLQRQQRQAELARKKAGVRLVHHLLSLAAGCVQFRARIARAIFMRRVRCVQRFIRYIARRKRFQLGMLEAYWKHEEAALLQAAKSRELRRLRNEIAAFVSWKEKARIRDTARHLHSAWHEGLQWSQKSFTLLSSLVEMRVQDLPDTELRHVAVDIGYIHRSPGPVPAHIRRDVLVSELQRRRRAYYVKVPRYKDALHSWKKQHELLAGHVTHESPEMRQKLLDFAGAVACPVAPVWAVLPSRPDLMSLMAEAKAVAQRSNAAYQGGPTGGGGGCAQPGCGADEGGGGGGGGGGGVVSRPPVGGFRHAQGRRNSDWMAKRLIE